MAKGQKVGAMRERVTIQSPPTSDDGMGGVSGSWVDVATVFAQVAPLSGRERLQADNMQSEVMWRITIRHRTDIAAGMRAIWNGQTFNVRSITYDQTKRFDILDCEAGVAV